MKFLKFFIIGSILMIFPLVLGASTFFDNPDEFFIMSNFTTPSPVIVTPTGGGGGGGIIMECLNDSGCGLGEFCFENKCRIYECDIDSDCNDTKTCWIGMCVKLFDMIIEEVSSPIRPGEFFNFTYFLKGVAEIHGDVIVKFWLVQNENIVTEGFDTIYMADFEEKKEISELFLPSSIGAGIYNFYVEVEYDSYYARAGRMIEVEEISKEVSEGIPITGGVIGEIGEGIKTNILAILIIAGVFILWIIIYWERRKIKKALIYEEKWMKRNKVSFFLGLFILILAGIVIYLNDVGVFSLPSIGKSFVNLFIGVLFLLRNYWIYFIVLLLVILIVFFYKRILKIIWRKKKKSFKPILRKQEPLEKKNGKYLIKDEKIKIRTEKSLLKKKKVIQKKKKENRFGKLLRRSHPKLFKELARIEGIPKIEKRPQKSIRTSNKLESMKSKIIETNEVSKKKKNIFRMRKRSSKVQKNLDKIKLIMSNSK